VWETDLTQLQQVIRSPIKMLMEKRHLGITSLVGTNIRQCEYSASWKILYPLAVLYRHERKDRREK
jgi:hypothetical protein